MTWFGLVVLIVLAIVLALPWLADRRRHLPATDHAPGEIVDLSQGATHVQWHGPVRGPVVVAIHGLTTPSVVWDDIAQGLGGLGYRVLTYDLYGRGLSGNARGDQGPAFFVRQLHDLLDHFGLTEEVTLMGYSMGGAIATAYGAAHPERVKRLVLIAPAGIEVVEDRAQKFARETPVLGDWLFAMLAPGRLRAAPGASGVAPQDLDRRGFLPSVLSSLRHMLHRRQETEHRAVAAADIPVIAIWGDSDAVVPLRALGTLTAWNRAVKQEVVAGADHGLPMTHGAAITALLRDVLREDWD